jgi:hypothetical protein
MNNMLRYIWAERFTVFDIVAIVAVGLMGILFSWIAAIILLLILTPINSYGKNKFLK